MKKILLFSMMLAIGGFVTSCKKDEETPVTPSKSNSEKLVGKWQLTAATVKDPSGSSDDVYASMDACEKDDTYTYSANGTYVMDEGAAKCNAQDPQTQSGTWSMNAAQTMLTQDGIETTIKSMTDTQMVLEFVIDLGGGDMTYTSTFSKQ